MKKELEKQLYEISPVFFQNAIDCINGKKNEMDTCMYWGCECGDGWFEPLKRMAFRMKVLNESAEKDGVKIHASQIKEKWGTLCVYLDVESNGNEEKEAEYIAFAYLIIKKAEEECNKVCEICGKRGSKENPIIKTTGGWISFICQDCAIESNKSDVINKFVGPYAFLSFDYKSDESFRYKGIDYATYAGAYYAQLKPDFTKIFATLKNPYDVFQLANIIMKPEEETDIIAVENMKDIIHFRFSLPFYKSQLQKTKNLKLVFGNNFHDNFYGQCFCDKCKDIQGENILGKILMEERNNLL